MIKEIACDTFMHRLYCDKCSLEMKRLQPMPGNPVMYRHACECSPEEFVDLDKGYPYFTFKEIQDYEPLHVAPDQPSTEM